MRLQLLDHIVGVGSFWNCSAPAAALGVFLVGLLVWCVAKREDASRLGLVVTFVGIVAFLIACAVDGVRNVHDIDELGSAARGSYGLQLDDAQVADLLDSSDTSRVTVAGETGTSYGITGVVEGGRAREVELVRLSDGRFAITADGQELPRAN